MSIGTKTYRRIKCLLSDRKFQKKFKSIKNIGVLLNSDLDHSNNFSFSRNDLLRYTTNLKEDFQFTLYKPHSKTTQIELSSFDFLIVIGRLNKNVEASSSLSSLKNLPKGLIIEYSDIIRDQSYLNHFNVVWTPDLKRIKSLDNKINCFHIENPESVDTKVNKPNWDDQYFSSQIKKGIQSIINDKTRITNRIHSNENFKVGLNSFYSKNFEIVGENSFVEMGSFCSIGNNVRIYLSNHDVNYATTQGYLYRKFFNTDHPGEMNSTPSHSRSKGPVIIKNDVWIGDDVKIMSGVTIGNGACIAAGSVVTKDIADYGIAGGVPAKILKFRFKQNIINFLLEVKWWNWSNKMISINSIFFDTNFNEVENVDEIKINFIKEKL